MTSSMPQVMKTSSSSEIEKKSTKLATGTQSTPQAFSAVVLVAERKNKRLARSQRTDLRRKLLQQQFFLKMKDLFEATPLDKVEDLIATPINQLQLSMNKESWQSSCGLTQPQIQWI
eukprot:m.41548 g.41548  ORF g.41548 m.41548 type:complete len:117 (-) comp10435_c0_seq3:1583-1933(-)